MGQTKANSDLALSKVTQQDGGKTGITIQVFHPEAVLVTLISSLGYYVPIPSTPAFSHRHAMAKQFMRPRPPRLSSNHTVQVTRHSAHPLGARRAWHQGQTGT